MSHPLSTVVPQPSLRPHPPARLRARRGFALEVVLLMLVMFTVIILAGMSAVTTISRTSNADYRGARVSYASEGGADDVMSQLDAAMQDGIVSGEDIANIETPEVPGYVITHETQTTGLPVSRTITSGPFSGLYSLNQPIDIQVTAKDSTGSRATSILSVNAQTIPLFQFGVFYEGDLEILPGPPMTFVGWVHTNGHLYVSSNNATFQSNVTTPDSVFWRRKNSSERLGGVRINNAAGTAVLLDFDSRSHAGAAFKARSELRFNSRLMSGAHGVKPLKLPLPDGMPALTLVLPRDAGDNSMVQSVKMAWKADWYVTVNADIFAIPDSNTMMTSLCATMAQVRTGGLEVPSAAACRRIFKARRNAFYEGREDRRADLIDIHMDSLRIWSDSSRATRAPRILYVNVVNVDSAATHNDLVSVRLRQGQRLPAPATSADTGGLTVATERPLYVLGDYNTQVWRPAALMGDAITFLSNPPNPAMQVAGTPPTGIRCNGNTGWCDSLQINYAHRGARPTTVNAAILAGHSATNCDANRAGCGASVYGGGLENFPRFLENWNSIVFRYTGSLVSLYTSRFAQGAWGNNINPGFANGPYYTAPTRQWSFDVNFRFPERLPPGTPSVGTVLQTAFRPLY